MLKAILGFLFGTDTNIFNKNGRVEHDLGKRNGKTGTIVSRKTQTMTLKNIKA